MDIGGLAGRQEASSLSLSLTVVSRERDWSPGGLRSRSRGRAGETVATEHCLMPVGPGCPLTGRRHFWQLRTGADLATCTLPALSPSAREAISSALGARGAVLAALSARGAFTEGGGRAGPPSTSSSRTAVSMRSSRLCSLRSRALGARLLLFFSGTGGLEGFLTQEAHAGAGVGGRIPEPPP